MVRRCALSLSLSLSVNVFLCVCVNWSVWVWECVPVAFYFDGAGEGLEVGFVCWIVQNDCRSDISKEHTGCAQSSWG